jgi:CheY-like chemotaxis protein
VSGDVPHIASTTTEARVVAEEARSRPPTRSPSAASTSHPLDAHLQPADRSAGAPWCILLVDDRSERRAIMRMVVGTVPPAGRTSVEVIEASDAAGASAAAERRAVDAAIIEVNLAGGGGVEVIEALRGAHPALTLVICSFRADGETRTRASRAGADAYLAKPVGRGELLAACQALRHPSPGDRAE